MLQFHQDDTVNRVLNLLNQHSRSVVRGLQRQLIEQAMQRQQLAGEVLDAALADLHRQGLIEPPDDSIRLTGDGYELLIRDDVADDGRSLETDEHGEPLSEYSLRGLLMELLASNRLRARGQIQAAALAEQWDAGRQRAGDLRTALDLLIRDGQLSVGRLRGTRFRLEKDGSAYMLGRPAPRPLADGSPMPSPETMAAHELDNETLTAMTVYQFRGELRDEPMSADMLCYLIERQFALHTPLAHHAVELSHRLGLLDWDPAEHKLILTDAGEELRSRADNGKLPARVSNKLATQADRADRGAGGEA